MGTVHDALHQVEIWYRHATLKIDLRQTLREANQRRIIFLLCLTPFLRYDAAECVAEGFTSGCVLQWVHLNLPPNTSQRSLEHYLGDRPTQM